MQPFTAPANYLTFAYVGGNGSGPLNFALGGHLADTALSGSKSRTIIEHNDSNVPIGLFLKTKALRFPNSSPSCREICWQSSPMDSLKSSTPKKKEIGMEEFKSMLLSRAQKIAAGDLWRVARRDDEVWETDR